MCSAVPGSQRKATLQDIGMGRMVLLLQRKVAMPERLLNWMRQAMKHVRLTYQ